MHRVKPRLALLLLILAGPATGQYLGATIAPSVVVPGQSVTVTVTGTPTNPGVTLPMVVSAIRLGSPTGPLALGFGCGNCFGVTVGPGGTATTVFTWPLNLTAPVYYIEVTYIVGGAFATESFPVGVAPADPSLVGTGGGTSSPTLRVGMLTNLLLNGTTFAGAPYVAAAATTTNTGFPLPGGGWATLDVTSPLFSLSYPSPPPGIFLAFQGNLNAAGAATLGVAVPALPQLASEAVAIQAVVVSPLSGLPVPTNTLTFTILP